jgi:hypothetical protein
MRWPRVRFKIGGLMILILLVGLTIVGVKEFRAYSAYRHANLVREVAESALKEYEEGYAQELKTYEGQLAKARVDLERSRDQLERLTRQRERGLVEPNKVAADQLGQVQAEFEVEQAKLQIEVLKKYTHEKQLKKFVSELEKARDEEQSALKASQIARFGQSSSGSP